ncbi:hypothetical protein H5410_043373 [Solanum commersonii]|uniref:Carbohydrate kinase PfkB domain-containing protein n=1 Tax=Solanum commersonii TaxID=4109 RepID=A0A9J5XWZ6_SOLCO|nr:hypothetical protein H5410_043373 [Solanum commersonii]
MAAFRFKMSISSTPQTAAIPENHSVLGCGMAAVDFLVAVDSYPNPDDKIRSTSFQVQGGGNAGNALTCAARLGLSPRIISKRSYILVYVLGDMPGYNSMCRYINQVWSTAATPDIFYHEEGYYIVNSRMKRICTKSSTLALTVATTDP